MGNGNNDMLYMPLKQEESHILQIEDNQQQNNLLQNSFQQNNLLQNTFQQNNLLQNSFQQNDLQQKARSGEANPNDELVKEQETLAWKTDITIAMTEQEKELKQFQQPEQEVKEQPKKLSMAEMTEEKARLEKLLGEKQDKYEEINTGLKQARNQLLIYTRMADADKSNSGYQEMKEHYEQSVRMMWYKNSYSESRHG